MRQITSEHKFSSVNNAGVTTSVRTSTAARRSGLFIKGKSMIPRSPASNLGPDPIVFVPYFVAGRMRRPFTPRCRR